MKYCEGKTMCFRKPSVIAYAAVVGKAENEGPYGGEFDEVVEDNKAGSDTWEQAESLFQQRAVGHVLRKSGLEPDRIDLMIAGDLLNQCVGSSYGLKDYFIPYLGIYGACSTFAEGLLLSAALVNAGYIDTAIASTSSHFSTAERQFRFPLNYGGVRTPTAPMAASAPLPPSGPPPPPEPHWSGSAGSLRLYGLRQSARSRIWESPTSTTWEPRWQAQPTTR